MAVDRVPTAPTLAPGDLLGRPAESVLDVIAGAPVDRVAFYGFGKAALRDGFAGRGYGAGAAIVLPALVPDGVVEPIRELGLTPRFYDVNPDLTPDLADVEATVDDRAAALVAVHYFGVPQRRFGALAGLAREHDVDLVSDNAHGPLSREAGRLLGTRGTLGITSLWKLLPIPDGAALYVDDGDAYMRERSAFAGVAGRHRPAEVTFAAKSLAMGVRDRHPAAARAFRWFSSNGTSGTPDDERAAERDPAAAYQRAKQPMSRLSARVCARTDPGTVVTERRAAYRAWVDHLADVPDVDPVFRGLPEGACPQACPVLVADRAQASAIIDAVPGAHLGPPLPRDVTVSEEYSATVDVAARLVQLPCYRPIDEPAVRRAAAKLH